MKRTFHQRADTKFHESCPYCAVDQVPREIGAVCGYCHAVVVDVRVNEGDIYPSTYMEQKPMTMRELFKPKGKPMADANKLTRGLILRNYPNEKNIQAFVTCPQCSQTVYFHIDARGKISAQCETADCVEIEEQENAEKTA